MSEDETEEYELTPHKELEELKAQVERLKKNPFGSKNSSKDLLQSMDTLSSSIKELIEIFKIASQDVKQEEEEESTINEKIEPITQKVDEVLDQNKKIAEGIVSVADTLKEKSSTSLPPEPQFDDEEDLEDEDDEITLPPPRVQHEPHFSHAPRKDYYSSQQSEDEPLHTRPAPASLAAEPSPQPGSFPTRSASFGGFPSPPPPMENAEPEPYDFPAPPGLSRPPKPQQESHSKQPQLEPPAPRASFEQYNAPPSPPPPPLGGNYKTPLPPLFSGPDDEDSSPLPPPQGEDEPPTPPKKGGFFSKFK